MSDSFSEIHVSIENQNRTEATRISLDIEAIAELLGCDPEEGIVKSAIRYLEEGHRVRIGSSGIPHAEGRFAYVTFLLTPVKQGEIPDLAAPRSIISLHGGHKS